MGINSFVGRLIPEALRKTAVSRDIADGNVLNNDSLRSAVTALDELPIQEQHPTQIYDSRRCSTDSLPSTRSSPDRPSVFHDCRADSQEDVNDLDQNDLENGLDSLDHQSRDHSLPISPPDPTLDQAVGRSHSIYQDDSTIAVSNVTQNMKKKAKINAERARVLAGLHSAIDVDQTPIAATFYSPSLSSYDISDNQRHPHYAINHHLAAHQAASSNSLTSNSGILIAHGVEQWMSVPALLLLCPFGGMVSTLAILDNNNYNWQLCLAQNNVRRLVYRFQCGAFSGLLFLGIVVSSIRNNSCVYRKVISLIFNVDTVFGRQVCAGSLSWDESKRSLSHVPTTAGWTCACLWSGYFNY